MGKPKGYLNSEEDIIDIPGHPLDDPDWLTAPHGRDLHKVLKKWERIDPCQSKCDEE